MPHEVQASTLRFAVVPSSTPCLRNSGRPEMRWIADVFILRASRGCMEEGTGNREGLAIRFQCLAVGF